MLPDDDPLSLAPEASIWPQEFEAARCPDAAFASAWEIIPSTFRAAIKNAIALAAFHFGETAPRQGYSQCDFTHGFSQKTYLEAVPWAAIIFDAKFKAPARLAASCLLAALCGVRDICAISAGGAPLPQTLVTLELCGIEDLFCPQTENLPAAFAKLTPEGRITIFDKPEIACLLKDLTGVITHIEDRRPTLFMPDPRNFDLEALSLAQGACPEELLAPKEGPLDALYIEHSHSANGCAPEIGQFASEKKPACPQARLTLGPGLEAFWLLENYGPEFFRTSKSSFVWLPAAQTNDA